MIYLAAWCAGLGGLLIEMVLVRRHGLLLGNTAAAAAVVLALFLLGLGVGGLLVGRLGSGRLGPRGWAAGLYAAVGLAAVACDAWLSRAGAVSWPVGVTMAAIAPGLLAVGMGMAFPLLFLLQPAGPWRSGGLVGANLAGSVAAAWLGGNIWIPELGQTLTVVVGAGAYGLAAVVLAAGRGAAPRAAVSRRRLPWFAGAAPAFAAGVMVLGLEILLLRRLPFWLEGLQPTLSGVITACLLGLTAGSAFGTGVLRRWCGPRAAYVALAFAAVAISAGVHELAPPAVAGQPIRSDLGLHLRILGASLAGSFLPFFALGAVVPLILARLRHRDSRAILAGRLFFWQGVGALVGALLVGEILPRLCPRSYFAAAPAALVATSLLFCWRSGGWPVRTALGYAVVACLGLSGSGSVLWPAPPVAGSRYDRPSSYRYVDHRSDSGVTASVVYDRRQLSMALYTDGFRAAETGPGTAYMRALGHLPMLLRSDLRRLAVVALGTGTTANAVAIWPEATEIHVVEISPAVFSLVPYFSGDGPVGAGLEPARFATDPRTRSHLTDGRRFLALQPPGSLDLVTLEPLLPYAPGTGPLYSAEFYELAGRTLSDRGLLVQWVPTHAMPVSTFDTLLATFAHSFRHCSVWLVDQSTLLVGSREPHLPEPAELRGRLQALPNELAAALHETGLARVVDVEAAFIGDDVLAVCGDAPILRDDRPFVERVGYWSGRRKLEFLPQNLGRLQAIAKASPPGPWSDAAARELRLRRLDGLRALAQARLLPGGAALGDAVRSLAAVRTSWPESVLLHREETLALRSLLERRVYQLHGRRVLELARRHLQRDPRSALLWASMALPEPSATPPVDEAERRLAVATAMALDPLLLEGAPPFLAVLAELAPPDGVSPLEDLATLPTADGLAAAATTPGAAGLALQGAFPTRVARALLERLRQRELVAVERDALRRTLDPLSLDLAAVAVTARGGRLGDELYPLWRSDLPMPDTLRSALRGDVAERIELGRVLRGHRGARAAAVLAELLLDPDLVVRTEAGVTLFGTWGERVPYDPQWDESRRRTAAEKLRSLHNPGS